MQRERALIPKDAGNWSLDDWHWEMRQQSEISGRDLQKPFKELKNKNSFLHDKY
jgi:hypothetical protein